jgi:hypothetical protein
MDRQSTAIRIRNLITEQDEGSTITLPRIQGAIATLLQSWARTAFRDSRRILFQRRFEAEVEAGELDLTPYLDGTEGQISLPDLRLSTIYVDDIGDLVQKTAGTWVGSWQQLTAPRPGGAKIPAFFLDGTTLKMRTAKEDTLDTDDDLLDASETISFTVPNFPATTDDIPPTLEQDFVMFAAAALGGAK